MANFNVRGHDLILDSEDIYQLLTGCPYLVGQRGLNAYDVILDGSGYWHQNENLLKYLVDPEAVRLADADDWGPYVYEDSGLPSLNIEMKNLTSWGWGDPVGTTNLPTQYVYNHISVPRRGLKNQVGADDDLVTNYKHSVRLSLNLYLSWYRQCRSAAQARSDHYAELYRRHTNLWLNKGWDLNEIPPFTNRPTIHLPNQFASLETAYDTMVAELDVLINEVSQLIDELDNLGSGDFPPVEELPGGGLSFSYSYSTIYEKLKENTGLDPELARLPYTIGGTLWLGRSVDYDPYPGAPFPNSVTYHLLSPKGFIFDNQTKNKYFTQSLTLPKLKQFPDLFDTDFGADELSYREILSTDGPVVSWYRPQLIASYLNLTQVASPGEEITSLRQILPASSKYVNSRRHRWFGKLQASGQKLNHPPERRYRFMRQDGIVKEGALNRQYRLGTQPEAITMQMHPALPRPCLILNGSYNHRAVHTNRDILEQKTPEVDRIIRYLSTTNFSFHSNWQEEINLGLWNNEPDRQSSLINADLTDTTPRFPISRISAGSRSGYRVVTGRMYHHTHDGETVGNYPEIPSLTHSVSRKTSYANPNMSERGYLKEGWAIPALNNLADGGGSSYVNDYGRYQQPRIANPVHGYGSYPSYETFVDRLGDRYLGLENVHADPGVLGYRRGYQIVPEPEIVYATTRDDLPPAWKWPYTDGGVTSGYHTYNYTWTIKNIYSYDDVIWNAQDPIARPDPVWIWKLAYDASHTHELDRPGTGGNAGNFTAAFSHQANIYYILNGQPGAVPDGGSGQITSIQELVSFSQSYIGTFYNTPENNYNNSVAYSFTAKTDQEIKDIAFKPDYTWPITLDPAFLPAKVSLYSNPYSLHSNLTLATPNSPHNPPAFQFPPVDGETYTQAWANSVSFPGYPLRPISQFNPDQRQDPNYLLESLQQQHSWYNLITGFTGEVSNLGKLYTKIYKVTEADDIH